MSEINKWSVFSVILSIMCALAAVDFLKNATNALIFFEELLSFIYYAT